MIHNLGLVYTAQSGQPYSILMGGNPNADGAGGNDLLFVPENYSDIVWKGTAAPRPRPSGTTYLTRRRASTSTAAASRTRNGLDAPWIHTLDFHYDITIPISVVQVQLTFDVLNLINLIDNNSGLLRYVNEPDVHGAHLLGNRLRHGQADLHGQRRDALDEGRQYSTQDLRSRYQLKFGARVSF